jgi:hypothetical protein
MKKFTANYLMNGHGDFLKNGIVVAEDDGTVLQCIDTSDNLIEIAGLSFLNGILMANCMFVKSDASVASMESNSLLSTMISKAVEGLDQFPIQNLIDLAKDIQEQFPEMNIPEILNEIKLNLFLQAGFAMETKSGILLLLGVDLPRLRFTSKSKLRKIL